MNSGLRVFFPSASTKNSGGHKSEPSMIPISLLLCKAGRNLESQLRYFFLPSNLVGIPWGKLGRRKEGDEILVDKLRLEAVEDMVTGSKDY